MSAHKIFWRFWIVDNWGKIKLGEEWVPITGQLYWQRKNKPKERK